MGLCLYIYDIHPHQFTIGISEPWEGKCPQNDRPFIIMPYLILFPSTRFKDSNEWMVCDVKQAMVILRGMADHRFSNVYTLFTADLELWCKFSKIYNYADDTTSSCQGKNLVEIIDNLKQDAEAIHNYYKSLAQSLAHSYKWKFVWKKIKKENRQLYSLAYNYMF